MKNIIKIGDKFNDLTVISESPSISSQKQVECVCICGIIKKYRYDHIKAERIKSCGCLKKRKPGAKTHGMTNTKEYSIWSDMKKRCYNIKTQNYKYYGDRGITVCDRWLNSFENFISDMGTCPNKTSSIERKDNNLGYCTDNCEWIDLKNQASNRRSSVKLNINGIIMGMTQLATMLSADYNYMNKIYHKGTLATYLLKHYNIKLI